MVKRLMIIIDEDKCTGCALCVPNCAEGALQIVDGVAKVVSESYCDGLGACLGHCPEGALTLREVETVEFDEEAAMAYVAQTRGQAAV
ncbi:MAG: ATP-binding protein, partial [Candidatus Thorarchaeota archaeon]